MPNDSLNYAALIMELNSQIAGGRVNKIVTPSKDTVILSISNNRATHNLLLSANAQTPRCHLTTAEYSNLSSPSSFLLHLRKHISGAIITNITQIPFERVITFNLTAKTQLGHAFPMSLIIEISGAKSNLILLGEDSKITDCIKHVSLNSAPFRLLLPRVQYLPPTPQSKIAPNDIDGLQKCTDLYKEVYGLDKVTVAEAVFRGNPAKTLQELIAQTKSPDPCAIFNNDGSIKQFCFTPYEHLTICGTTHIEYCTLSQAMDKFYSAQTSNSPFASKASAIKRSLENSVAKFQKRLALYKKQRDESQDFETDRIKGELITANIYRINPGSTTLEADNYYCPDNSAVKITLNPRLTPAQNASAYYKRFGKKKKSLEQLSILENQTLEQLDTAQTILFDLTQCVTMEDLNDIALELNLPAARNALKGAQKQNTSSPHKTVIDGYIVLIGKNSAQNDRLTRDASPNDLWLHTQKIHGSHVIIQNHDKKPIPSEIIKRAAGFAAYHSKAKSSTNVPVDYTLIKHVSRPKGAPLGKVIYTNQTTVYVEPKQSEQ